MFVSTFESFFLSSLIFPTFPYFFTRLTAISDRVSDPLLPKSIIHAFSFLFILLLSFAFDTVSTVFRRLSVLRNFSLFDRSFVMDIRIGRQTTTSAITRGADATGMKMVEQRTRDGDR